MGAWHRYIQWRARGRNAMPADAGITLIEIIVAITLLATALIGTAGEIAASIKHQAEEKSQVDANHLADTWFEYAESLEHATTNVETVTGNTVTTTVATANPPIASNYTTTTTVHGVAFLETVQPHICTPANLAASANPTTCTGTLSPTNTIFSAIKITWSLGGQSHQITMIRNLSDNSLYNPANTNDPANNGLTDCTRAGTPTAVTLTASPATVPTFNGATSPVTGRAYVDGTSGNPTKDATGASIVGDPGITVTLKEDGLVDTTDTTSAGFGPATCVPLYWTDTAGTHQIDMHTTTACAFPAPKATTYLSTQCTYTGVLANTSVAVTSPTTASAAATPPWPSVSSTSGYDATVPFCAYLSGTGACTTATTSVTGSVAVTPLYVNVAPGLSACSINGGTTIATLGGHPLLNATVQCTGSDLASGDTIIATYPTGQASPTTATVTLSFVSGTTWRGTLLTSAHVQTGILHTDTFTFAVSRASDHEPATSSANIIMNGT